jgi:hypothetical protein
MSETLLHRAVDGQLQAMVLGVVASGQMWSSEFEEVER